jgi:hypothetical protein
MTRNKEETKKEIKKETEKDRNKKQARNVKHGNRPAYFELQSRSTLLKRDYIHRHRVPVILDDNRQDVSQALRSSCLSHVTAATT